MGRRNRTLSRSLIRFAALLALGTSAQAAPTADDPCPTPDVRNDIRPGRGGPATEVRVGVRLIDLLRVSDVDQTLTADLGVIVRWTDPRLADWKGCEVSLDDIWSPGVVFLNAGRVFPSRPKEAGIGPGGAVTYVQRYHVTLATNHDLRDFPFDHQTFRIVLASLEWPEDQIRLVADEQVTGRRERLNISDWTIGAVKAVGGREYADVFDRFHSTYELQIAAQRVQSYYVWKVLLPLTLIVAMSWSVFWIDPGLFGPQIGLSATSMLTLIAFIFATTNMVPELGYFTRLDTFIGGATILVFSALVQSIVTTRLVAADRKDLAQRTDRWCRWVYPLAFAALLILA